MNLKMMISLFATCAVFRLMAAYESETTLCRLEVNSGTKGTILSMPLTQVGVVGDGISLDKVVMPDNLVDGTILFASVGGETLAWVLSGGAWQPTTLVDGSRFSDSAAVAGLKRGSAFWIERAGTAEDLAKPFYLFGKFTADVSFDQTIAAASVVDDEIIPAFTRIANPNIRDFDIQAAFRANATKPADGDEIVWGNSNSPLKTISYFWNAGKGGWAQNVARIDEDGVLRFDVVVPEKIILPVGQGFWYVRKTASSFTLGISK